MNSPEFSHEGAEIDRVRAEWLVQNLSDALEGVRHHVVNRARYSTLSSVEQIFPTEVAWLTEAVAAAHGLPVEGGTTSTSYYVAEGEGYVRSPLGLPPGLKPHYFEGVVWSVGEIPVPHVNKTIMQLCIGIAPLSILQGQLFDSRMDEHYKHFGRSRQLHHPFDKDEYRDAILYLPVDSASDRGIHLLDGWNT